MGRLILMSIKPRFAYEILSGFKRFELRVGSGVRSGDRVFLYASSPVKAVVGEFLVGRVFVGPYDEVYELIISIPSSGVGEDDFSYVRGRRRGSVMAIEVVNPTKYLTPIPLATLRELGLRNPPRSYMFLDPRNEVHLRIIGKVGSIVKNTRTLSSSLVLG